MCFQSEKQMDHQQSASGRAYHHRLVDLPGQQQRYNAIPLVSNESISSTSSYFKLNLYQNQVSNLGGAFESMTGPHLLL